MDEFAVRTLLTMLMMLIGIVAIAAWIVDNSQPRWQITAALLVTVATFGFWLLHSLAS